MPSASSDRNPPHLAIRLPLLHLLAILIIGTLLTSMMWIGQLGSDDASYYEAAVIMLEEGPYLPTSHFSIRYPTVASIAASLAIFGEGEFQAVLPSLVYYFVLVVLAYSIGIKYFSPTIAFASALIILVTPLFPVYATIANVDFAEAILGLASLYFFYVWKHESHNNRLLILSGLLAGIAFLNRETAGALGFIYGLYFLFEPHRRKLPYLYIGLGFLLPIAIEAFYYAVVTGDALYRWHVLFSSAGGPKLTIAGEVDSGTGNLTDNRLLGPWVAMLLNQEFGLLFWILPFALWTLIKNTDNNPKEQALFKLLAGTIIIWIISDFYFLGLRPLPRYFALPAVASAIVIGVFFIRTVQQRPRIALISISFFVGLNLLLMDLENKDPMIASHVATEIAAEGKTVYTDPRTRQRSRILMRWAQAPMDLIRDDEVPPGSTVVYFKPRSTPETTPRDTWLELKRVQVGSTILGRLLALTGLDQVAKNFGLNRLLWTTPPVVVYQAR